VEPVRTDVYSRNQKEEISAQWGVSVSPQTPPEKVVATANILRQHFASQAFGKEDLLVNVPLHA